MGYERYEDRARCGEEHGQTKEKVKEITSRSETLPISLILSVVVNVCPYTVIFIEFYWF